jgi:hypothetical protein
MTPRPLTLLSVAALAALALSGCASQPFAAGGHGRAVATLAADGSVSLTIRKGGLFGGRGQTVVFHPGDPGYDAVRGQVDAVATGARKPVLTWSIGQPTYTN